MRQDVPPAYAEAKARYLIAKDPAEALRYLLGTDDIEAGLRDYDARRTKAATEQNIQVARAESATITVAGPESSSTSVSSPNEFDVGENSSPQSDAMPAEQSRMSMQSINNAAKVEDRGTIAPQAASSKRYTNAPGNVVLPNGEFVPDKGSANGRLQTSGVDLNLLANDARIVGRLFQEEMKSHDKRIAERRLRLALFRYVGQGGDYDEQRESKWLPHLPPFSQHPEYQKISNFNVGLFCQQAGLSLDDTLKIAGSYAKGFSSNAKPNNSYGLSDEQREFTELGWNAGEEKGFARPPIHIELDDEFYRRLSVETRLVKSVLP